MPNYHGEFEGAFPRTTIVDGKHHNHPLYSKFIGMLNRCNNPKMESYPRYGGRGIRVYEDWNNSKHGWINFSFWVLEKYPNIEELLAQKYEIDRIDVDGNYYPENIRFVPSLVNQRNKSNHNRYKWVDGNEYLITEIFELFNPLNLCISTVRQRLEKYNWEPYLAMTTPAAEILLNMEKANPTVKWMGGEYPLKGLVINFSLLPYKLVAKRVRRGWDTERALTEPVEQGRYQRQIGTKKRVKPV